MTPDVKAGAPGRAGSLDDTALWKALAVSEANRYTGALAVSDGGRSGTISFDHGRVVHAECGELRGEAALEAMMRWASSSYTLDADVPPTQVSITRRLATVLNELRDGEPRPAPPPSPAPAATPPGGWIAEAAEKIRALPGVLGATLHAGEAPVAGLAPRTPGELAAASLHVPARRLAEALGLGRVVLALGRGAERLVLLIFAREHQLTVLLRDDDRAEGLKSQIRALLNPPH